MNRKNVMVQTSTRGHLVVFIVLSCITCVIGENSLLNCYVEPFDFPCYGDTCTFPDEYCSSAKHERHCNPCHESLCGNRQPLQCGHFCANLSRQQQHAEDIVRTVPVTTVPVTTGDGENSDCYSINWMIVAIVESVILVLAVILTPILWAWPWWQQWRDIRRKLSSKSRPSIMTQTSRSHEADNAATNHNAPTQCPADDKLKNVIPTEKPHDTYRPTTTLAKSKRPTEERTPAADSPDNTVQGVERSLDGRVTADSTAAGGTNHAEPDEETALLEVVTGDNTRADDAVGTNHAGLDEENPLLGDVRGDDTGADGADTSIRRINGVPDEETERLQIDTGEA